MFYPLKRSGFTLIELLVVIAIIAILASILFPVFAKAREKARQTTCTSQVRQLATAIQMYAQDNNGKYPGCTTASSWVTLIDTYVGNSKMYHCPSDANTDDAAISYAYNTTLVKTQPNIGDGVAESQITAPSDVGALCDADPSGSTAGLIGGGAFLGPDYTRSPSPRHTGVIVGFCDGHAKFSPGKTWNDRDVSNPIVKGFYTAAAMGLVDNPSAGFESSGATAGTAPTIAGTCSGQVTIGGDWVLRPYLYAAADMWKRAGGSYTMTKWQGQNEKVPSGYYCYGCGDGRAGTAIAYDDVLVIISKNSKLNTTSLTAATGGLSAAGCTLFFDSSKIGDGTWFTNTATIAAMYSVTPVGMPVGQQYAGYSANNYQCYCMDSTKSGTAVFFNAKIGDTAAANLVPGKNCVTVSNDAEMLEKVAADPYGVGYISSIFYDPDRVNVLGLQCGADSKSGPVVDANGALTNLGTTLTLFPCSDIKGAVRWILPTSASAAYPLARTLYVKTGGSYQTGFCSQITNSAASYINYFLTQGANATPTTMFVSSYFLQP